MREQRMASLRMLAQFVVALPRVVGQQRQIGGDEGPFLVADITGLASAFPYSHPTIHATSLHTSFL
jgi:hypothetical protein